MVQMILYRLQPFVAQQCKSHMLIRHSLLINKFCFYSTECKQKAEEVYYGTLTPRIKGVKMFSLTTSAAGILAQPALYQQVTAYGGSLPLSIALGSFIGFFTFVTPFLLHYITKKYVTRITHDNGTYTAWLLTFFLRPRQIVFKPEDVEIPEVLGPFTSFNIKGEPVFVDSRYFTDKEHYIKIMGYDKPIDFKLGLDLDDKTSKIKPHQ